MRIDIEKLRLAAIKKKFVRVGRCQCCGNLFKFERMWTVHRRVHLNDMILEWYYCKNCMPTKVDVLHEIDTDAHPYGVAGIDDDREFKTDDTKMKEREAKFQAMRPKIPGKQEK